MALYNKGINSRASILSNARRLLNEKGLGLTMDMIAQGLGLTRGRITHFFPTKDSLLMGIMQDYEHGISQILQTFDWGKGPDFEKLLQIHEITMDLQYDFRCAIAYVSIITKNQPEVHQHIESSFGNRVDGIKMRLQFMVRNKFLNAEILKPQEFDIYCFQYTNLLTTWVVSQELYYSNRTYKSMKPVYIRAAQNLFIPYLTVRGKKLFNKSMENWLKDRKHK